MQKPPLVSVIMPNYNNEPFLFEAINSVLDQSFKDFEFIIIDDGSNDKSVEIIRSFDDKRINLILKKENSGIVDALNIGIEEAVGKYMIRMDGDDISVGGRFGELVSYMEGHPEIGVCSTDLKSFGDIKQEQVWKLGTSIKRNKAEMIFSSPIGHASAIFKLSLFRRHNLKYEKGYPYIEDYKLFTRLNKLCDMYNINKPLYLVRIYESSSTYINRKTHGERLSLIHRELLSELGINDIILTKKNLKTHFELGQRKLPTGNYQEYLKWCNLLIDKNNVNEIYPKKEFILVVKENLELIEYKLIEKNPFIVFYIFYLKRQISTQQLRYAIGVLRKLIFKK